MHMYVPVCRYRNQCQGSSLVAPCLLLPLILELTNPTRRVDFKSQGSSCLCSPSFGIYRHVSPYPAFTWVQGIQMQALRWCSGHYAQSTLFPALSAVLSALDKLAVGPVHSLIYPHCSLISARPLHKCHMPTEVFKDSSSHSKESSFTLSFKTNQKHTSHVYACLPLLSPQKNVSSTRPDNVERFIYFYVIL